VRNAIYEGTVIHQRLRPTRHSFTYRVSYYFFDLGNPPRTFHLPPFLSFNPKKYLSTNEVQRHVEEKFGASLSKQITKIYILTQLSYFGYTFNPVSFYYCYGEDGNLLAILSLITNTPWGEKHANCFRFDKYSPEHKFEKEFHVSPFMPMEIDYTWKFNSPEDLIRVHMANRHKTETDNFFFASMDLRYHELNLKNVLKSIIKYPCMSFKTILAIHWQALILYLKKTPFYTHPKKRGSPYDTKSIT
jgi:uncharacterized protein